MTTRIRPDEAAAAEAAAEPDQLFSAPRERVGDFHFGAETAAVFDDMLHRSVPFYDEIQRQVAELVADFAADGTQVVDLGCATCETFVAIARQLPPERQVRFLGLDSSEPMLDKARRKLASTGFPYPCELRVADLNEGVSFSGASVALMILTLQFVRPLYRERLMRQVVDGLEENGCLLLVEKVLGEHSVLNRLFIKNYYELKRRNGYSDLEIAQKREALENVLVPYRMDENRELLVRAGFRHVDVFFKWYNFCAFVAVK